MSGGGFAVSRSHGGEDRFYNAPAMRRHHQQPHQHQQQQQQQQHQHQHQQQLLQQQHHHHHLQQLHRHHQLLFLQQQQQIQIQRHQQHQFQRLPPVAAAPPLATVRAENRPVSGDSTATLSKPPAVLPPPPPPTNVTNLDRLLEAVTPSVPAKTLYEVSLRGWKSREAEVHPFYSLGDLWESYREWSVYGAGVPLVLNGRDSIVQYYVPYLSGIQLYVEPLKPQPRLRRPGIGSEGDSSQRDKVVNNSPTDEADISNSPGRLVFEYLEKEQPHNRLPLTDKVSVLESQFPELRMYKSCDLLPSSWMCVAWYPIYRIPVGPTLKDLEASFLTFYSLSTHFRSTASGQPCVPRPRVSGQNVQPTVGSSQKVSLPVFGLASYKFKGSLLNPCGPHECEQENALLQAAGDWLKRLQVLLPDYKFFLSHYSKRR